MNDKTAESLGRAVGNVLIFASAFGVCWLLVRWFEITWDRALLVVILWLTCLLRIHQNPKKDDVP